MIRFFTYKFGTAEYVAGNIEFPHIEGCGKSNYEIYKLLVDTQRILLVDGYYRYDFELDDCVQIPVCDCQSSLLCV